MNARLRHRSGAALLLTLWFMACATASADAVGAREEPSHRATVDAVPIWLAIPRIELETPIVSAGWQERTGRRVWDVPADAAGWHLGSARMGERNNLVLSGHNNIGGSVFRDLSKLAVGDTVIVRSQVSARQYTVTTRLIIREALQSDEQRMKNARWMGEFPGERVTLITCYPAWTNTHRLVIVAKPNQVVTLSRARMHGLIEEE